MLQEYQLLYLDNDIPINKSFYCNNGDIKARGLEVHVLDNSVAKDCTGLELRMIVKVPSGEMFEATVANGLVTVLNVTGGIYQVLFPNNMGKGRLTAEIQLSNTVPEVIVSRKFSILGDGSLTSDGNISVLPGAGMLAPIIVAEPERVAAEVLRKTDEAARKTAETTRAGFYTGFDTSLAAITPVIDKVSNPASRILPNPLFNRYNINTALLDMIISKTNGTVYSTVGYYTSDYTEVTPGEYLVCFGIPSNDIFRDVMFRYAFFNENKVFVSGGENPNHFLTSYGKTLVPAGVKYIRFCYKKESVSVFLTDPIICPIMPSWPVAFTGYTPNVITPASDWYGKKWLTYGDSIVHIGYGDALLNGWQRVPNEYHGFSKHYCRGVGGSAVANGTGTFWTYLDGQYAGRNLTPTTVADKATLDGMTTSIGLYYATAEATYYYRPVTSVLWIAVTERKLSMCRWDRIKAMIPESIRNTLDLVVVMGGTNDHLGNIALGAVTWSTANTTDTEWIADVTNGNGGDYGIDTYKGAMASMIMKLQKWCPNAVIVVASQLSGYGVSKNMTVNSLSLTPEDYANAALDVAHKMSAPSIDVFGTTGINQQNTTMYITDGTHPYSRAGMLALGRAVAAGLKRIIPRLV